MSLFSLLGFSFWDFSLIIGIILIILALILWFVFRGKIGGLINLYIGLAGLALIIFGESMRWLFDEPLRLFIAALILLIIGVGYGLFIYKPKRKKK